jgi:hypothetical protein
MTTTTQSPVRRRRWLAAGLATGLALGLTATGSPGLAAQPSATTVVTTGDGRGNPKAYNFIAKINGEPVHWSPCAKPGWRINLRRAPKRAIPQAKEAMQRVKQATGLHFRYEGRTRVNPKKLDSYPRGTSLVMGWGRPKATGGAAGVGGPRWKSNGRIIDGYVVLNSRVSRKLASGFGRGHKSGYQGTVGQLMMHELGHAVGLQHVRDSKQIMYPTLTRKKATWGAGDKNGLRKVGKAAGCF